MSMLTTRRVEVMFAFALLIAGCARDEPAMSPPAAVTSAATTASGPSGGHRLDDLPWLPPSAGTAERAARIAAADHVILHRLEGEMPNLPEGTPIPPDVFVVSDEESRILATRKCDATTSRPLLTALHDMMLMPHQPIYASCFEPAFGVEVVAADGRTVFRGMFCFMCMAYAYQADNGKGAGEPMTRNAETARLHALLNRMMPLPPDADDPHDMDDTPATPSSSASAPAP